MKLISLIFHIYCQLKDLFMSYPSTTPLLIFILSKNHNYLLPYFVFNASWNAINLNQLTEFQVFILYPYIDMSVLLTLRKTDLIIKTLYSIIARTIYCDAFKNIRN